jgi:hypothetical protein
MGLAIEAIERPKAKERQKEHGKTAPGRNKNTGGKLPPVKEKTRDAVGSALGMSGKTYERAKAKERKEQFSGRPRKGEKTGGKLPPDTKSKTRGFSVTRWHFISG